MTSTLVRIVMLIMFGLALAACGESESEEVGERGEAFAPICEMAAMTGATGLPDSFPAVSSVTFVKTEEAGPSVIVEGWAEGDLEDVYDDIHGKFEDSDYDIIFDEQEEHDAEISFKGGGRSGQVKLADECGDGRVYVRVTSRPE
jgi:hypothetical protein